MIEIKFYTDNITNSIPNKLKKGYTNILNKKLVAFENEIKKGSGEIHLKMTGESNEADLFFKNMPQELIDKIKKTLGKSP